MDTWLAVASKRDVRRYADRPIPDDVVNRFLDAGRLAEFPEHGSNLIVRTLRAQFACETGQCRLGFDAMIDGARSHCLHSRADDLAALRALPTRGMRLEQVERRLQTAVETARVVNRILGDDAQPPIKFEHLDRWLAALARVEERRLKEAG